MDKKIVEGYSDLKTMQKTLVISSMQENGEAHVSYAPFVEYEKELFIYISRITEHYAAIQQSPLIEVMIIKDEAETQNMFARERIRLKCTPSIEKEGDYEEVFQLFATKHPKPLIDMLRGLDFSLFKLKPVGGRYIVGFGQAYDVDLLNDELHHVVIDKNKHQDK